MNIRVKDNDYLLDADDYKLIENKLLNVHPDGYLLVYQGSGKYEYFHRLVTNPSKNMTVDHINRNVLDNRKENLRVVSRSANCQNSVGPRPNNTSGYKGVGWSKQKNKWRARLKLNYKDIHVGYYDSLEEAVENVELARIKYHKYAPNTNEGVAV